jgi:hypothetical protein
MDANKREPQMNVDARRYSVVESIRELSEVYLRTSALICGWIYSVCLRVHSRPFAVNFLFPN